MPLVFQGKKKSSLNTPKVRKSRKPKLRITRMHNLPKSKIKKTHPSKQQPSLCNKTGNEKRKLQLKQHISFHNKTEQEKTKKILPSATGKFDFLIILC